MSPIIPNDYSNQAPSRIEVLIDGRPNIHICCLQNIHEYSQPWQTFRNIPNDYWIKLLESLSN